MLSVEEARALSEIEPELAKVSFSSFRSPLQVHIDTDTIHAHVAPPGKPHRLLVKAHPNPR